MPQPNREFALLKHLFCLVTKGTCYEDKNPVTGLKLLPWGFHRHALSEQQKLLCGPWHRQDLVAFTVLRHSGILALRCSEIDVTQKRKNPVTIPLTEGKSYRGQAKVASETAALISAYVLYPSGKRGQCVFGQRCSSRTFKHPPTITDINAGRL